MDLARVLTSPRWRHPAGPATKQDIRQFRLDINNHLGIRYRAEDNPKDPLLRWFRARHDSTQLSLTY